MPDATSLLPSPLVVAGVDVGGTRKGFHAVTLSDGIYRDQFGSGDPYEIAKWCRQSCAHLVGVDAPCQWSITGRARSAERELMKEKIWCFSTPTREAATAHSKDHFRWMLNGAELFLHLQSTHALFNGDPRQLLHSLCFETFPQAIACALAGKVVSAAKKRVVRRALLSRAGMDVSRLTNIDQVDAALCALTAHHFVAGNFKTYGDPFSGHIVVPRLPLISD